MSNGRIIVNNKLERMWKCHGPLWHIIPQTAWATSETHEKSVLTLDVLATIWTMHLLNKSQKHIRLSYIAQ